MALRTLAVVAAALAVAVPAALAAAGGPTVTVVSKSPLQLRGVSFRPGIVVTVTLATEQGRIVRRLRTSAVGRFTARFAVAVDSCNGANAATVSTNPAIDSISGSFRVGRAPRSSLSTSSGAPALSPSPSGRAAQPCGLAIAW